MKSNSDKSAQDRNIRGSTLLLSGRVLAIGLNFLVQVATIRYLVKHDFGVIAFAFALSESLTVMLAFGMDTTVAKFASIYHERGDDRRLAGCVLFATVTVALLGLAVVAIALIFPTEIATALSIELTGIPVVMVFIVATPVNAMDRVLESLFATMGSARTIMVRRHLLRPVLKLLAVVTVIATGGSVLALAVGHLCAAILGAALYVGLLIRTTMKSKWATRLRSKPIVLPVREMLEFSVPQFASDTAIMLRGMVALFMLQKFSGTTSIADYSAILPLARLNDIVIVAFASLYTPTAARLLAQGKPQELSRFYWQTTAWITVLSFPIFAVTFALARPMTTLLCGDKYAESSHYLSLIAFGLFFHAALGLNACTLRVEGRVRIAAAVDIISTILALAICSWLVPRDGTLGAAVSTCVILIFFGLAKQAALLRFTNVVKFRWNNLRVFMNSLLIVALVTLIQWIWSPPLVIGCAVVIGCWSAILFFSRKTLDAQSTFPELLRIPVVRNLMR